MIYTLCVIVVNLVTVLFIATMCLLNTDVKAL